MNYSDKMDLISPFVSFGFKTKNRKRDYTRREKWLISYYYNQLFADESVTHKAGVEIVAHKTKSKKIKKASGYRGAKIKAIPVPVLDKQSARIKEIGDKLEIVENNVRRIVNPWGDEINNPLTKKNRAKIIAEKLSEHPDNTQFTIMAGNFEIYSRRVEGEFLNREIEKLQNQYKNYKKWLFGVVAYEFQNQLNADEYFQKLAKAKRGKKPRKSRGKNHGRSAKSRRR